MECPISTWKNVQCKNLLMKLRKQKEVQSSLCDVAISTSSGKIFMAHKAILASCSEYFETMFLAEMQEKGSDVIQMNGIMCEVFETLLDFMYGQITELTEDNIYEITAAAEYLQVTDLKLECHKFILDTLSVKNCLKYCLYGQKYDVQVVLNKVVDVVRNNFEQVSSSEKFMQLTADELACVLKTTKAELPEEDICRAICDWTNQRSSERASSFEKLFSIVRLSQLSEDFIEEFLLNEDLVKRSSFCCHQISVELMKRIRLQQDLGSIFLEEKIRKHSETRPDASFAEDSNLTQVSSPSLSSSSGITEDEPPSDELLNKYKETLFSGNLSKARSLRRKIEAQYESSESSSFDLLELGEKLLGAGDYLESLPSFSAAASLFSRDHDDPQGSERARICVLGMFRACKGVLASVADPAKAKLVVGGHVIPLMRDVKERVETAAARFGGDEASICESAVRILALIGSALATIDEHDAHEATFKERLARLRKTFGCGVGERAVYAGVLEGFGDWCQKRSRCAEARSCFERAIDAYECSGEIGRGRKASVRRCQKKMQEVGTEEA